MNAVYTTSVQSDNALRIAQVLAGPRIKAEREAKEKSSNDS